MATFTAAQFVECLNAEESAQVQRGLDQFLRACSLPPVGSKRKRSDGATAATSPDTAKGCPDCLRDYLKSSPHCAELFRLWDEHITGTSKLRGMDAKQSQHIHMKVIQVLTLVLSQAKEDGFRATRMVVVKTLLQKKMRSLHSALTSSEDASIVRRIVHLFTAIVQQGLAFSRELSHKLSFSSSALLGPLLKSIYGKKAPSKPLFEAYLSFAIRLMEVGPAATRQTLLRPEGLLSILLSHSFQTLSPSHTLTLIQALHTYILQNKEIPMHRKTELLGQRKVLVGGLLECLNSKNEALRHAARSLFEELIDDVENGRQLRKIKVIIAAALAPASDPMQADLLVKVLESDSEVKATYMRSGWKLTLEPRPSFQWLRNVTVAVRIIQAGAGPQEKGNELALPPEDLLPKSMVSRGIQHEKRLVVLQSLDLAIAMLAHCYGVLSGEDGERAARMRMEIIGRMPDASVIQATRSKWIADAWITHRATRLLYWYQQVIPLTLTGRVDFSKLFAQLSFDAANPISSAIVYILLQLLDSPTASASAAHIPKLLNVYRNLPDARLRSIARQVFRKALRHMVLWDDDLVVDACLDMIKNEREERFLMGVLHALKAKSTPPSSAEVAVVMLGKAAEPEEVSFAMNVALYSFLISDEAARTRLRDSASSKQALQLIELFEALSRGDGVSCFTDDNSLESAMELKIMVDVEGSCAALMEEFRDNKMDLSVAVRYCTLLSHIAGSWIEANRRPNPLVGIMLVLQTAAQSFSSAEIVHACLHHEVFKTGAFFCACNEAEVVAVCIIMRTVESISTKQGYGVVTAAKTQFGNLLSSAQLNVRELDVCSYAMFSFSNFISPTECCALAKSIAKRLENSPGLATVSLLNVWLHELKHSHDLVDETVRLAKTFETDGHLELLHEVITGHTEGHNRTGGLRRFLLSQAAPFAGVSWLWSSLKNRRSTKSKVLELFVSMSPDIRDEVCRYFKKSLESGAEERASALFDVFVMASNGALSSDPQMTVLAHHTCQDIMRNPGISYKEEVTAFIRRCGSVKTISRIIDEHVREQKAKVLPMELMQAWLDMDMSLRLDEERGGRFLGRYWSSAFHAKGHTPKVAEKLRAAAQELRMAKAHQRNAFKVGRRKLRHRLSAHVLEVMRLLVEHSSEDVVKEEAHHIQVALVSHSEFIRLMSAPPRLQRETLLLLLRITKKNPEACWPVFIMLQSFYQSTLSPNDLLLRQLLRVYADFDAIFHPASFGYLFGSMVQPELFDGEIEVDEGAQAAVLLNTRYVPLLEALSAEKLQNTVAKFPCWRSVNGDESTSADAEIYDVAFLIPLLDHLLSMFQCALIEDDPEEDTVILPCREVVTTGALSLLLKGLSSECEQIRKHAAAALRRFGQLASRATLFRERSQIILLLRSVRYAVASPGTRVCGLITSFLAESAQLMLNPAHALYPMVNSFLLKRPSVDVKDVPMFYELFNTGEEGSGGTLCRSWMLRVLAQGVHSKADLHVLARRYVLSSVLAFLGNPLISAKEKGLALELLDRVVAVRPEGAVALVNVGIFPWLASTCSTPGSTSSIDSVFIPLLRLCSRIMPDALKEKSGAGMVQQVSICVRSVMDMLRRVKKADLEDALFHVINLTAGACGLSVEEVEGEVSWQLRSDSHNPSELELPLESLSWLFSSMQNYGSRNYSTLLDKAFYVLLHCQVAANEPASTDQWEPILSLCFDAALTASDHYKAVRVKLLHRKLSQIRRSGNLPPLGQLDGALSTLLLHIA